MRAVALLAVIAIHAQSHALGPASHAVDMLARFSVPAFVLLAGVLLAYRYTGKPLGVPFMRRRFSRTLLPWLVWAPLYIVFTIYIGELGSDSTSILNWLALGGGHLWFLLLIPQLYLLLLVWPRRGRWMLAVIAMVVQTALCLMRLYVVLPGWGSSLVLTYAVEIFPFWIGYFAVSVALGDALQRPSRLRRVINVWRGPLAAVSALAAAGSGYLLLAVQYPGAPYAPTFLSGTGSFLNPVLPLFVFSVAALVALASPPLMQRARFVRAAITEVSETSLGVYIVHPMLLFFLATYVLKGWIAHGGAISWVAFGTLIVLTLAASLLVVRVLSATPVAVTLGTPRQPLLGRRAQRERREAA